MDTVGLLVLVAAAMRARCSVAFAGRGTGRRRRGAFDSGGRRHFDAEGGEAAVNKGDASMKGTTKLGCSARHPNKRGLQWWRERQVPGDWGRYQSLGSSADHAF